MNRERLKEDEIKKISSETKTTAQVNRATRRMKVPSRIPKKTTPLRTPSVSEAEESTKAAPPNTSTPQYFDMTVDDVVDQMFIDVEVEEERKREQERNKKKKAAEIVSRHLGEDVRDLPYLQGMSSSSTGPLIYKPIFSSDLPAEDTSRGRGRPPTKVKTIDGSENTTQKRTKNTPQEPESMVVNKEGDQQKRTKKEPASASEKKKRKTKEELLKIKAEEREAKTDEKLEAKIVKEVKKSRAKGVEPKNVKIIHGVELIENKNKSFFLHNYKKYYSQIFFLNLFQFFSSNECSCSFHKCQKTLLANFLY
jgi:hypothetical protein